MPAGPTRASNASDPMEGPVNLAPEVDFLQQLLPDSNEPYDRRVSPALFPVGWADDVLIVENPQAIECPEKFVSLRFRRPSRRLPGTCCAEFAPLALGEKLIPRNVLVLRNIIVQGAARCGRARSAPACVGGGYHSVCSRVACYARAAHTFSPDIAMEAQ